MTRSHHALLVGVEPRPRETVDAALLRVGHHATRVRTLSEAEAALEAQAFCYALVSCSLEPHGQGAASLASTLSLVRRVRRAYVVQALPVAALGSPAEAGRHFGALVWAGCTDFLTLPLDVERLVQRVSVAALMCEARRAACALHPAPPLAGERLYGVERAVHFVGASRRRRFLVRFDEEELYLPGRLFEGLFALALALLEDPERYSARREVFGEHPHAAISKLRQALQTAGVAACLQQDNRGGVRLSVPPDRLSFAREFLREEHPQLVERLEASTRLG